MPDAIVADAFARRTDGGIPDGTPVAAAGADAPPRRLRVLAWPMARNRALNPYNALLYEAMQGDADVAEFTPRRALAERWDVVHVHWPEHALGEPGTTGVAAAVRVTAALALLALARRRGARVLWTAHNLRAHESRFPRLERILWAGFTRLADGAVALSASGRDAALAAHPSLARVPWTVIPHGHYRAAHAAPAGRAAARAALGVPAGARVILFFGQIRPYKNVGALLRAFRALDDPRAVLLVAGRPSDSALADAVRAAARADGRVRAMLEHVAPEQVPQLFGAADLVALPYAEVLNSGSAMLALSLDRPLLVPRIGALAELADAAGADWVRTFEGVLDGGTLAGALAWAAEGPRAPRPSLDAFDWPGIARGTLAFYARVTDRDRAAASTGQASAAHGDERARRLGYLSGAPRVTTRADTAATGPRAHILGVMGAFRALGWTVEPYIVGDRLPAVVGRRGERFVSAGLVRTLAADLARLALRVMHARGAERELRGRVDWVYERFAAFQALGRAFQRRGVPWVLETNGPFYEEAKSDRRSMVLSGVARRLEHAAYRRCDVLVCVSEALRDILLRDTRGLDARKVLIVPNGVDTRTFDPAAHPVRRTFAEFTVGFVGSLIAWQGIDVLLRAIARLRDDGGPVVHAAIAGDGQARAEWEALTHALQLDDRVRFVGRVLPDDVPAFINGVDAGFAGHAGRDGTRTYHSPLKIYEYLAMGTPVIATRSEDAERLVRPEETGFLFDAGDVASLAQALASAHAARDRLAAMGARGRTEIVAEHSWEARVRTMIAEIDARLAASGRRT